MYRGELGSVYHGEHGLRTLREVACTHLAITRDLIRVMARVKATLGDSLYRPAGLCTSPPGRMARQAGGTERASPSGILLSAVDALAALPQQGRHELLVKSRKHSAVKLLRQIPAIGPIRAALRVAIMQTPRRFRTKRQL